MVTKQQLTFYLNVFTLDLLIGFLFYSYHYGSHFGNFYFWESLNFFLYRVLKF